jgi:hypothetical protein
MATQQDPHRDLIELAWKALYAGKTIEVHPLALGDGETTTTFTSTADTSSGNLLNATPSAAYTKGEFTIPSNAASTFSTSTRKATYAPQGFNITAGSSNTSALTFNQYFVLLKDGANTSVVLISKPLTTTVSLAAGQTYSGFINLEI